MLTRSEIKAIAEEICRILKKTYEDPTDRFLNVREAASFLSVSKSYIYHNLDKIPHIRKNRRIRFSRNQLTHFIKQ